MNECILCYDELVIMSIGKCDHACICYKCTSKSRQKVKNNKCPICNTILEEVILSKEKKQFNEFDIFELQIYEDGILYTDSCIKEMLDELNALKCLLPNCQDKIVFNNLVSLKKHLKDSHNRYLCEVCMEFKTATLNEQKLYSKLQFERHMSKGDIDEDGNIILLHPYDSFCARHFYNEDDFITHINTNHFNCHLCKAIHQQQVQMQQLQMSSLRFIYYRDYKSLERHFRASHFICEEEECLQKSFIVFETHPELELHMSKQHSSYYDKKIQKFKHKQLNNKNLIQISGFYYNDDDINKNQFKIKDKEGVNFEDQFLSIKNKTSLDEKDCHKDEQIDIRNFYNCDNEEYEKQVAQAFNEVINTDDYFYNEQNTFQDYTDKFKDSKTIDQKIDEQKGININSQAFMMDQSQQDQYQEEQFYQFQEQQIQQQLYRENMQMEELMYLQQQSNQYDVQQDQYNQMLYHQYQQSMNNLINEKQIFLEDIKAVKYNQLDMLSFDCLQLKFKNYLNEVQMMQLTFVYQTYITEQIDEQMLIDLMLQGFGYKITIYLFPFIISSISEESLQQKLDIVYMNVLKQLPRRTQCLLNKCQNYTELFNSVINEIETEMKLRIMQRKVSFVNKKPTVDRQQLFQFIEILRRVKTRDMGRLKFLTNLGLSIKNISQIKNTVFLGLHDSNQQNQDKQEKFRRFFEDYDNDQLQKIYTYSYICQSLINKKNVHEDVKFLCVNIFHKVVQKNPQLKALVKYNISDEEYQIYQFNLFDTQKQIDTKKIKQLEQEARKKEQRPIDCINDEDNQDSNNNYNQTILQSNIEMAREQIKQELNSNQILLGKTQIKSNQQSNNQSLVTKPIQVEEQKDQKVNQQKKKLKLQNKNQEFQPEKIINQPQIQSQVKVQEKQQKIINILQDNDEELNQQEEIQKQQYEQQQSLLQQQQQKANEIQEKAEIEQQQQYEVDNYDLEKKKKFQTEERIFEFPDLLKNENIQLSKKMKQLKKPKNNQAYYPQQKEDESEEETQVNKKNNKGKNKYMLSGGFH